MAKEYQIIKTTEQGFDEMTVFLLNSGFAYLRKTKKEYLISEEQKIEISKDKNILRLIKVDESIKESLEHIAKQEIVR
jgi:hypothetical protein